MGRITALLIGVSLASCSGQEGGQQNQLSQFIESNLYVTEQQNGTMVPLRPGQAFEVRLRGNATTDPSIQWTLTETPAHLRQLGVRIVSDSSGATQVFRFGAVAEGESRLVFDAQGLGRRVSFTVAAYNSMVID